jgi:hypothetical protein
MRFIPKGYMGSEAAIVHIAKTRDPSHWTADRISPDEQAVWDGLGKTLNAELLDSHLRVLVKKPDDTMMDRLCDFSDALAELIKALFAGEITAEFVDENGKLNFILKNGWGGNQGADILLRGVVDLVGGRRRVVLLKTDEIDRLARSLPPADPEQKGTGAATKGRALKRPTTEKRQIFKLWWESLNGRIPTRAEAIAAMKDRGINRDDTRELLKAYPRPRGKPRSSKKTSVNRRAKRPTRKKS